MKTASSKQRETIIKIKNQLDSLNPADMPEELVQALNTTIDLLNNNDLLPNLISDNKWQDVDSNQASFVISTMINLSRMTKPYQPSPYPGIPKEAEYVFQAKYGNKNCVICHARITPQVDWTAKINGQYENYCVACASVERVNYDDGRLTIAMTHPGLHIANNKVWRVDETGVYVKVYGATYKRVTRNLPVIDGTTILTPERARAYAREHKQCVACSENIGHGTTRRSLAAGYGPVCAKRYNWPYPTEQQAETILAAEPTPVDH